jgi:hydroxymethylbilane synthase
VGTSSLRRKFQLAALRPDLRIETLRGNVDSRLRKLNEGQFDAIVLAEAGVHRLGLRVDGQQLDRVVVPAIGQGALALETRADDAPLRKLLEPLHDRSADLAVRVERTVLSALGGNCVVPIGAVAFVEGEQLRANGFFANEDGTRTARAEVSGGVADPEALGAQLAASLRAALGSH